MKPYYGSNVWVSKEVKKRLDNIRGDLSYSAMIERLLDGPNKAINDGTAPTVTVNGVDYVSVEAIKRIITEGLP